MNAEHVAEFVTLLRTTDAPQCQGHLAEDDGRTRAYCCLGLGSEKAAGVEFVIKMDYNDEEDNEYPNPKGALAVANSGEWELAPPEFIEWLGLPEELGGRDILLDIGREIGALYQQGTEHTQHHTQPLLAGIGLATLNDSGCTFAQIADCIEYFGLSTYPS